MKILSRLLKLFFIVLAAFLTTNSICDNGGSNPPADAGLYHTYSEINDEIHALANAHADIAHVSSIGQSVQGREIWAIKISDNAQQNEEEPAVVFMGAHHAREWISVDTPFLIAKYLVEKYASDANIKSLVNNAEIWIVPMVNPDGHQYSVTTDRLWRKNRRNNGDGSYGVDLNRNYAKEWGGPGSSGDTFSETYRGPAPFSEPETRACRDFLQTVTPAALITYHSYSQLVLFPWGYTSNPASDKALLQSLATTLASKINSVHGKTYTPEQSSALYLASGDTTDWLYWLLGVPAFTIELRPASAWPGFKLPESEIQATFEENLPAALYLVEWIIANG